MDDVRKIIELRLAIKNSDFNTKMSSSQKRIKEFHQEVDKTRDKQKKWYQETRGGLRVFGTQGLLGAIALVRNHLLLLAFAIGGVIATMSSLIKSSIEMRNSLVGLTAVADSTGQSMYNAKEAAMGLAKTGLLTVSEAAAGLKNLLATGLNIDQATELMTAFTDAAAFNRQGTLKLGEAVVGATQGYKNQLSMLIDNAGITKNLKNMYDDYAASIGTSAGKLTELQKYEAARIGILKEALIFQGNAKKLTQEYSGQVSKLGVSIFELKAALGDTLIPTLSKMISKTQESVSEMNKFFKANKDIIGLKIDKYFGSIASIVSGLAKSLKTLTTEGGPALEFFLNIGGYALLFGAFSKSLSMVAATSSKLIPVLKNLFITTSLVGGYTMTTSSVVGNFTGVLGKLFTRTNIIVAALSALVFTLMKLKSRYEDNLRSGQLYYANMSKETRQAIDQKKGYIELLKTKKEYLDKTYNAPDKESVIKKISKDIEEAEKNLKRLNDSLDDFQFRMEGRSIMGDVQRKEEGGFFGNIQKLLGEKSLGLTNKLISMGVPETILKPFMDASLDMVLSYKQLQAEADTFGLSIKNQNEYLEFGSKNLKEQAEILKYVEGRFIAAKEANSQFTDEIYRWLVLLTDLHKLKLEKTIESVSNSTTKWATELKKIPDLWERMMVGEDWLKDFDKYMKDYFNQTEEYWGAFWEKMHQIYFEKYRDSINKRSEAIEKAIEIEKQGAIEQTEVVKEYLEAQMDTVKESISLYMNLGQSLGNTFMQQFESIQEIKNSATAQIADLNDQFRRGAIDEIELQLRKEEVMIESNARIFNAQQKTYKSLINTATNFTMELMSKFIQDLILKEAAFNAVKASMMGIGAGLGLGLLAGGIGLLTSKLFPEKDVNTYTAINPETDKASEERKRFGQIGQAAVQYITIIPTVSVANNQSVFIGAGSISEFEESVSTIMIDSVQSALDNGTIRLEGISPK